MHYYNSYGFGGYGVFSIWPMVIHGLFWVVIFGLIYWMLTRTSHGPHCCGGHAHDGKSPTDRSDDHYAVIIKERYAKGEISKKEFEELKADLTDESEKSDAE